MGAIWFLRHRRGFVAFVTQKTAENQRFLIFRRVEQSYDRLYSPFFCVQKSTFSG